MIKHVVMWRLAGEAGGLSREANLREIRARLSALAEAIPEILEFEVGLDINRTERAADVVLVSGFTSREDLATYSRHPRHQAVVKFIRALTAEVRVVDYEV